jgi:hypothetical protein
VSHRAGGVGRLVALRTAAPRHAGVTVAHPRRRKLLAVTAVLLILGALSPLLMREPEQPANPVALPVISIPPLPTVIATPAPVGSPGALRAVRQARKATPAPILLGPAENAGLPDLVGAYCRATYGGLTLAASTADGWVCARLGRGNTAVDMDAMCRHRYGAAAWADLGDESDPRSWRCYRDGP